MITVNFPCFHLAIRKRCRNHLKILIESTPLVSDVNLSLDVSAALTPPEEDTPMGESKESCHGKPIQVGEIKIPQFVTAFQ